MSQIKSPMQTRPCIAVATDFSARADRAVDRALQLSKDMKSRLCVLHALDLFEADRADWPALNRRMRECVGVDEEAGVVEYLYPEGSPPAAIGKACEENDAALLVVGPARYNSLGDYFLGTAIDHVLRNTIRPVLVVKNRVREPYRTIIAGTDFSEGSAGAIAAAARMFPDAAIHVVHAWEVPFKGLQQDSYVVDETRAEHEKRMQAFMVDLVASEPALEKATVEMVQGGALQAIRKGLKRDTNALVALGSHGASGWRQAAIGSVTSDLLRCVEADVLVINAKGSGT